MAKSNSIRQKNETNKNSGCPFTVEGNMAVKVRADTENNRREVMALLVDIWPSICVLSFSPLFKRPHSLTGKTQNRNKNTTQPLEKKKKKKKNL